MLSDMVLAKSVEPKFTGCVKKLRLRVQSRTESSPSDFETEDKGIILVKARDYIDSLQQVQYRPLFKKKQKLRNRAPDKCIARLRELLTV